VEAFNRFAEKSREFHIRVHTLRTLREQHAPFAEEGLAVQHTREEAAEILRELEHLMREELAAL
jgi:hypothetical protein